MERSHRQFAYRRAWSVTGAFAFLVFSLPVSSEPQALQPSIQPHGSRQSFGAIAQPAPALPETLTDRNAAYFNRPGAIPRSSFQPINNSANNGQALAPAVSGQAVSAQPSQAAPVTFPRSAVGSAPVAPSQHGMQTMIRPFPVGQRVLKERSRPVPGIIIQPKAASAVPQRLLPPQGTGQQAPAAGIAPVTAAPPAAPSQSGLFQIQAAQSQGTLQPAPVRPGTIVAPQPIRRLAAPPVPKPISQTTGTVPTLAPRPNSLFQPKAKASLNPLTSGSR